MKSVIMSTGRAIIEYSCKCGAFFLFGRVRNGSEVGEKGGLWAQQD